jgi:HK97 family phage major capsid protein
MTDLLIPTSSTELEEMLNDKAQLAKLDEDPKALATWIGNYVKDQQRRDPDFQKRVNDEVQASVTKILDQERPKLAAEAKEEMDRQLAWRLKDEKAGKGRATGVNRLDQRPSNGAPGSAGWGARNALFNKTAAGARLDDADLFDNAAEFLQAINFQHEKLPGDRAKRTAALEAMHKIRNDYGSVVPSDGGFLIPESMRSDVMMIALEQSVTRPRATVIPMETLSVTIPGVDSTSNASSVFGGIVCYWTEEGASLTESQAKFRRIRLEAKKLTAYAEVPNELVADATAFGAFFNQAYPRAMAWYEDDGFMNGTGSGEPLGWLNSPAAVSVTKETGQPATTIVWENIVKAYARMLPSSLGNAEWVANIDSFPELATMALSVGTGGSAIWLNNGAEGPPMTILGRPVTFTEKVPTVGSAGDINFVDLSYYAIGDRQVMQAESSPHFRFQNDLTAYRFIQRVDGRPLIESAITPQAGQRDAVAVREGRRPGLIGSPAPGPAFTPRPGVIQHGNQPPSRRGKMQALGRLVNFLPTADNVYVNMRDAENAVFLCVGGNAETFTLTEAKDAAGTGAQALATLTQIWVNAGAAGATTWATAAPTSGSVATTTTALPVAVLEVSGAELSDTYDYIKVASSSTGTVVIITTDLKSQRSPANLPAIGA